MPPVITTGIPKVGDGVAPAVVYPRLELRKLLEDKDVANLYIQATARLQAVDEKDPNSWYQLASIHGRPYKPWDNVGENAELEKGRTGGYCTHSSVLFPSWHRPYLALFEQTLSKHAFDIANEFQGEDKKRYLAAARRFRIPYWDWAVNPELPYLIAFDEKTTVQTPQGPKEIDNPLYSYKFGALRSELSDGSPDGIKWTKWEKTVRYPTGNEKGATSQPVTMQKTLGSKHEILRDKVYILLTQTMDYNGFSNDSYIRDQDPITYNNIESIHNDIHGFVGWDGHMGEVDYAAFDPVFWMHHANVDRFFALWQALNPNTVIVPQHNASGTWTEKQGTEESVTTDLTPFRKPGGGFWNTTEVGDTEVFNYTYPQLKRLKSLDPKIKTANLHAHINTLYGSPVVDRLIDAYYESGEKVPPVPPNVPLASTSPVRAPTEPKITFVENPLPTDHWHNTASTADDRLHYHEWLVNIDVLKYEVKQSFVINIFIGKPDDDATKWVSNPNLVGSQVVFTNNVDTTGCENCIDHAAQNLKVTGTIPLTGWLGERIREKNLQLEPDVIKPYLANNLTYRVVKFGTVGEIITVESLRVFVGTALVEVPEPGAIPDEFPSWGPITVLDAPGTFNTTDVHPWFLPQAETSKVITFPKPFSAPPGLPLGLSTLDLDFTANVRVKAYASDIQKDKFVVHIDSWSDTKLYSAGVNWLEIAQDNSGFQYGQFLTTEDHAWNQPQAKTSRRITFKRPFSKPPKVISFLNQLDLAKDYNRRVSTTVTDIDAKGFTIHVDTWSDSVLYLGGAGWIAYPENSNRVYSGTANTQDVRPWNQPNAQNSKQIDFGGLTLQNAPKVFVALNSLDIDGRTNLRVKVSADNVTPTGLTWHIDSWNDTILYSAGLSYIVVA